MRIQVEKGFGVFSMFHIFSLFANFIFIFDYKLYHHLVLFSSFFPSSPLSPMNSSSSYLASRSSSSNNTVPIEFILPDEFHLDPTRGRYPGVSCPKCAKENIVFGIHNGDDRMVTCLGCKDCRFRWWLGRRIVCKDYIGKTDYKKSLY